MAAKYGLAQPELGSRVNWGFLDLCSRSSRHRPGIGQDPPAGFTRHPDTLEGFLKRFDEYCQARIMPTFESGATATG